MKEIIGAFWENFVAGVWLLTTGLICIRKGFKSSLKEKELKTFLADKNNTRQVKGFLKVIKIDYMHRHGIAYIVKITFTKENYEFFSTIKSFHTSLYYTNFLRKNKKKGEVPVTIYHDKKKLENLVIQEIKEVQYLHREKWFMPAIGIFFILAGIGIIYYRLQ